MSSVSLLKRFSILLLTVLCFGWAADVSQAAPAEPTQLVDREQAEQTGVDFERSRRWLDAIEHYEKALAKWPESDRLKYGLRRARFHFSIDRRYSDASFQNSLLRISRTDALQLLEEVLTRVRTHYVSPISSTSFVAHGTESLYLSLANDRFIETHLRGVDRGRIGQMRSVLREQYWNKPVANAQEALHMVEDVCSLGSRLLGLPATAVIMEYTFGGCNALDDYSGFLTPDRLDDLYDNIDGEFVGLGIEMKSETGKGLFLVNVLPESPAEAGGIHAGEYIVAIDGLDCRYMATDEAAGLLKGPTGSRVTLEVADSQSGRRREANLVRREVLVKSFPVVKMLDRQYGIGYIQMSGFQKSSAQELDAALNELHQQGMRSLVWDVRGNPGGLLSAAVEVLDRFLDRGVLVSTRGRIGSENYSYSAHPNKTWRMPLVLLTDGESASASEIVAGAVRDHKRGTIVGTKTYGKWSVQSIFPIDRSTGLRLTTAKFYSPLGHTHGKVGVQPDVLVEKPEAHMTAYRGGLDRQWESDPVMLKAVEILQQQKSPRQ